MPFRKTQCPACKTVSSFDPAMVRLTIHRTIRCLECRETFDPAGNEYRPKKNDDNKRRSTKQEERAAKRYNAKKQPASGALPSSTAKGDIRDKGALRGELKLTRKASYSLKLEELLKIEQEAAGSELALFEVEFQGVYPHRKYVVLRAEDFAVMKDDATMLARLRAESIGSNR